MKKIVIQNLFKIFGSHPEKAMRLVEQGLSKQEIMEKTRHGVGLVDVSFDVSEGEILVVMGLSGSGKSTLVRCINRLIEPTAGKVTVDGQDVIGLSEKELREFRQKHFGMVFQNFALFPHRTVLRNVEYGLEIQKVESAKRKDSAMKALEQVGLKGWEDAFPDQLSGGMQQRVGLARALALDADIMLMDEAFSALDPLIRREMQDELIKLQDKMRKTIVFISHDLDEAIKIGDRIVLMKDGGIVQTGTAEQILTNPANEYVAKFVEDVDMSKIITAEKIIKKSEAIAYYGTDGPHSAMRKMKKAGISKIFVRKDRQLAGIVTATDAAEAIRRGDKTLDRILIRDIQRVSPDTPAIDLFPLLTDNIYPIAVVDETNNLQGVIIKGFLLAALAECTSGSAKQNGETA
ncbi:MAG: glycine betaine/L-proline ABC transporter ATP-binding protein [Desulfobacterales bacterium]|nr:glycine betaine/L-proline ABC transporter ATP-binding protein [Desulfobacterales bacterium]